MSTIFARRAVFTCVHLHARTAIHTGDMQLMNHGYFDYGENLNTHNLSPLPGWKWHSFWDISLVYLWVPPINKMYADVFYSLRRGGDLQYTLSRCFMTLYLHIYTLCTKPFTLAKEDTKRTNIHPCLHSGPDHFTLQWPIGSCFPVILWACHLNKGHSKTWHILFESLTSVTIIKSTSNNTDSFLLAGMHCYG